MRACPVVLTIAAAGILTTAAPAQVFIPLPVTGYTQDVIADAGATALATTTTSFDEPPNDNPSTTHVLYEKGYNSDISDTRRSAERLDCHVAHAGIPTRPDQWQQRTPTELSRKPGNARVGNLDIGHAGPRGRTFAFARRRRRQTTIERGVPIHRGR